MHAAKRITRLIVIELGNGADWPPGARGMAVLTRNRQLAMGTMAAFGDLRSCASRKSGKCKKQDENEFGCNPITHDVHLAFVLFVPKIRKCSRRQIECRPGQFRSPSRMSSSRASVRSQAVKSCPPIGSFFPKLGACLKQKRLYKLLHSAVTANSGITKRFL